MNAPFDQLFHAGAVQAVAPVVIATGEEAEANIALSGLAGSLGAQGVAFLIGAGAPGDTLGEAVKFNITLSEGDETDGSDAELVTLAQAVFSRHGVGKNAQGGDFAAGVVAVIDADAEADTMYQIAYLGKKPVATLKIEAVGTHTNGTPWTVMALPISPRRQGQATSL